MCIVESSEAILAKNNNPITTSKKVAEHFSKRHDNVTRDIEKVKDNIGDTEFWNLNYEESKYKFRGKTLRMFNMTKDGFMFLVMGYTGIKASKIKVAYINAFNEMVEIIKARLESKVEHHSFAKAILSDHEVPKPYHFSNEYNMIYKIIFGMSGKKYLKSKGFSGKGPIKPFLSADQIHYLMQLQKLDEALMASNVDYEGRKKQLEEFYKNMRVKRLLEKVKRIGI